MMISVARLRVWLKGDINRVYSCLAGSKLCARPARGNKNKLRRGQQIEWHVPRRDFVKGDPKLNGQLSQLACLVHQLLAFWVPAVNVCPLKWEYNLKRQKILISLWISGPFADPSRLHFQSFYKCI